MNRFRLAGLALALGLSSALPSRAADSPAGTVVLAKSAPEALLLWDSSPVVAKLVGDRAGEARALATLESDAMTIAVERSGSLTGARNVTVQVIYAKTGAVSPVYNTATFAGVEKVLTVSGSTADILKNGGGYAAALQQGTVPAAIKVTVSGKLPPM